MANFSAVQADPDNPNSAQILSQFEYAYYADGQKASVAETVGGLTRTVNWKYDNLNRLMEETVAGEYTNRYQYDLSGNRRFLRNELDQILVEYTYNPQDHLLTEVSSAARSSYFYDENGSLIERVYGTNRGVDPNDQYIYNLQNQMADLFRSGAV